MEKIIKNATKKTKCILISKPSSGFKPIIKHYVFGHYPAKLTVTYRIEPSSVWHTPSIVACDSGRFFMCICIMHSAILGNWSCVRKKAGALLKAAAEGGKRGLAKNNTAGWISQTTWRSEGMKRGSRPEQQFHRVSEKRTVRACVIFFFHLQAE